MMSTAEKVLSAWGKYKKQRDGSYRGNCPYRTGSDSGGFVLTIDDGEHGAFTDHAGMESGSLYDLANKMGIETPKDGRVEVANTKQPYAGLADYAQRHFADVENFISAGWQEETLYGRPALTYPVQSGKRGRYIDEKADKNPYIWIGDNQGNCWYGLSRAINMALQSASPLVLCNGEASTITAQSYGVPAFCGVGGEGAISEAMQQELSDRWQGSIVIALDCDKKGKDASETLSELIPDSTVIDLNLSDGGDLADFCGLHGNEALGAIKRLTTPKQVNTQSETASLIEFIDSHSLLSTFNRFVHGEPELFGRVIKMPFASMRKAGGFAEIMTTKKIWLIGNVSGGGKTLLSESLCDEWNHMGYNTFYIGDEWTPMEMVARQLMRHSPVNNPVSYMDYLRHVNDQDHEFSNEDVENIAYAMRNVRMQEGKTWYMYVDKNHKSVVFLEDILESASAKIETLRANGSRIDVIILDYLSLYDTRAQITGNNVEEYKAGVLKSYCKSLDVLGVSTVQVNKVASDRVKSKGGFLSEDDLFWIRADKGNLITTMNRVFKTNLEINPDLSLDMDGKEIYKPYLDENGNPELTPNFCMVTAKNSVASPFEFAYFHFDFDRMKICEGVAPGYHYNSFHHILLPNDHPQADMRVNGHKKVDLSNL